MTWIVGPDLGDLGCLQCEARLNELPPELGTKIICQYDRRRFPPRILHDVLGVHPLVIVGEHVHQNVYFDPWALVAKGWTNREIGVRLGRTPGTIKNYIAAILSKLNVSDRTQPAVRAVEPGLVDRTFPGVHAGHPRETT